MSRPLYKRLTVVAIVAAGLLLAVDAATNFGRPQEGEDRARQAFTRLLDDLDETTRQAADAIELSGDREATRAHAFRVFERLARQHRPRAGGEWTWLLFDADGEAVAWAGRGLAHEVEPEALPNSGLLPTAGYTAVTLLKIEPIDSSRRPWRVGVGVGLPVDRLPGEARTTGAVSWSVLPEGGNDGGAAQPLEFGELRIVLGEPGREAPAQRTVVGSVGLLLLLVTLLIAAAAAVLIRRSGVAIVLLLAAGAATVLLARLPGELLVPLAIGMFLLYKRVPAPHTWTVGPLSLVSTVCLLAATVVLVGWLQHRLGPVDLAADLGGGPLLIVLRIGLLLFVLGLLHAVPRGLNGGGRFPFGAGAALGILLAAAVAHRYEVIGPLLAAVGSYIAVRWSATTAWERGHFGALASAFLLSALIGSLVWEMAHHRAIEATLRTTVERELQPPAPDELTQLREETAGYLADLPLESLATGDPTSLESGDLAYAVWRRSPLAKEGILSALSVGPVDQPLSTFGYGLPAAAVGRPQGRESIREIPGWSHSDLRGLGRLTLGGGPWAEIRFHLRPRPGFRSGKSLGEDFGRALLGGDDRQLLLNDLDLPPGVRYGIYDEDGRVLLEPWKGAVAITAGAPPARIRSPERSMETFSAVDSYGWRVLMQPIPSPLEALERIATHALSPLFSAGLFGVLILIHAWFQPYWRRRVQGAWRSFPRRLVAAYTTLLLVPVVLINVFVLGVFAGHLQRQEAANGEAALDSAQRVLGDYLAALDPGFGLETAFGDDLLLWLSQVVHHEVNLYWSGRLYTSSKPELFAAGLLPQRIPGAVQARLAIAGAEFAEQTSRAGNTKYREFFAPLRVPGVASNDSRLVLSVPLIAQESAAAEEMRAIRRRVILVAGGIALLLAWLGRRVASGFARPLLQIVEGTQEIAAGAPGIEVTAQDSEFVTLVEAINEMATRIARARSNLVREKEVVEKMLENITSGIVSVDGEGKVLLANRRAREMLDLDIGEALLAKVETRGDFGPVASFLRDADESVVENTVRLSCEGQDDREWSLIWLPLPGPGEPVALMVLEDVSEVLRGQRLQAWAEMARIIAHEVKNPLTPIRLSTEHLRAVHSAGGDDLDAAIERCTANILEQVDELQEIASEFSVYSHIPRMQVELADLAEAVEGVAEGYSAGGVDLSFHKSEGPWWAEFDRKLLRRVIRNLLENAIRAVSGGGGVDVSVTGDGDWLEVTVADEGEGVDPQLLPRIFEPYFSTADTGTGLGLPIARRIVEEHGGSIAARLRDSGGLAVTVRLPRARSNPGNNGVQANKA